MSPNFANVCIYHCMPTNPNAYMAMISAHDFIH